MLKIAQIFLFKKEKGKREIILRIRVCVCNNLEKQVLLTYSGQCAALNSHTYLKHPAASSGSIERGAFKGHKMHGE